MEFYCQINVAEVLAAIKESWCVINRGQQHVLITDNLNNCIHLHDILTCVLLKRVGLKIFSECFLESRFQGKFKDGIDWNNQFSRTT